MLDSLACALVKAVAWLCLRLPPGAAVWLGERFGTLGAWVAPRRVRIGVLNLLAAFDGKMDASEARRVIARCFRHMGAGIAELLRLPAVDAVYVDRYVVIHGQRHVDEALATGRPIIFLTGHYGNWELASIVAALKGHPVVALASTQKHFPKLYRLLISYRESKGCTVIHKGVGMRRLVEALGSGRPIGIVGDQASRQGIPVDFFGRPAFFATGPFALAYAKRAVILPAFMRRVRGPRHEFTFEEPIDLDRHAHEDEAVREGIRTFAGVLERRVREDPAQWLWMHKRWKRTPARRVLVLSDGKAGHLKQSLAVVEALRERCPVLAHTVATIRYRHRVTRLLATVWAMLAPRGAGAVACVRMALSGPSAREVLSRYADLIVSCGSSTAPVNLLWAGMNGAKSIVIMNPAPLPTSRFALVIAPKHDGLPARRNIVEVNGALSRVETDGCDQARARLTAHPKFRRGAELERHTGPVIAVLIGGDTTDYALTAPFAQHLLLQVAAACDELNGVFLVTTSRRTPPETERAIAERAGRHPRCRLLLLASLDSLDGTMERMLGAAHVAIVTGESVSMVSEACASGRHVIAVEPPLCRPQGRPPAKQRRFLAHLAAEGYLRVNQVPEVAMAIRRILAEQRPIKRLDDSIMIRTAVAQLL